MNTFLNRGALSWLPLCSLSVTTCMPFLADYSSFVLWSYPETHQASCFLHFHSVIDISKQKLVFHGVASTSQSRVTQQSSHLPVASFLSCLILNMRKLLVVVRLSSNRRGLLVENFHLKEKWGCLWLIINSKVKNYFSSKWRAWQQVSTTCTFSDSLGNDLDVYHCFYFSGLKALKITASKRILHEHISGKVPTI